MPRVDTWAGSRLPPLAARDNTVFVTPNTHPNELSVLVLLFVFCIAVVVLAFVALFCIGYQARKTKMLPPLPQHVGRANSTDSTDSTDSPPQTLLPIARPDPARLPHSSTRRELRRLHNVHDLRGYYAAAEHRPGERVAVRPSRPRRNKPPRNVSAAPTPVGALGVPLQRRERERE